jgi:rod shape-determining protein MreD
MTRRSILVTGLALAALVLVQACLVAFLPTPGAVPDLVVVAVLALGYGHGAVAGGLAGVWAGLLLDLVPAAAGPLGGWMLVLGLAGAAVGRMAGTLRPGPLGALVLIALGAGATVLARAGVLWFAGADPRAGVLLVAAASAGFALLLAPVALLATARRPRRGTAPARTVPVEVGAA